MAQKIMTWKKWAVVAAMLLIIAGACVELYFRYARRTVASVELPRGVYTVYGIDISAHNDTIDFEAAKNSIDFVFVKATEGATWKDRMFDYNYAEAKKAGLKVGAYHFFRFDRSGEAQAINLREAIEFKDLDFPVVIDIEDHGNAVEVKPEIVRSRLEKMVNMLQRYSIDVMFYSNKKGYYKYVGALYGGYPLWICSFTNPPIGEEWTFWQYSHEGMIPGCKRQLDLNVYNGSVEDFEAYIDAYKQSQPQRVKGAL